MPSLHKILTSKSTEAFIPKSDATSKFSLKNQYIVKQTGDENKENHQLEDIVLICHQKLFPFGNVYSVVTID